MSALPLRLAVLASGEGTNLQALVLAQQDGRLPIEIAGVFSDRTQARALERARRAGIHAEAFEPAAYADRDAHDAALFDAVAAVQPALIVLAGYLRLVSTASVERWSGRMINLHPSLLPKYPGLNTHAAALAAGDRVHGASVHFVTPVLDGGPVLARVEIPVHEGDTPESLAHRLASHEHRLLLASVGILARRSVAATPFGVSIDGRELDSPLTLAGDDRLYDAAGFVA